MDVPGERTLLIAEDVREDIRKVWGTLVLTTMRMWFIPNRRSEDVPMAVHHPVLRDTLVDQFLALLGCTDSTGWYRKEFRPIKACRGWVIPLRSVKVMQVAPSEPNSMVGDMWEVETILGRQWRFGWGHAKDHRSKTPARPSEILSSLTPWIWDAKQRLAATFALSSMDPHAGMGDRTMAGTAWWETDWHQELARMRAGHWWRVTTVNKRYFCDSYPPHFIAPRSVTDETITSIGGFRARHRVPAIVWVHGGVSLSRAAQPQTGFRQSRNSADEAYALGLVRAAVEDNTSPLDGGRRPHTTSAAAVARGEGGGAGVAGGAGRGKEDAADGTSSIRRVFDSWFDWVGGASAPSTGEACGTGAWDEDDGDGYKGSGRRTGPVLWFVDARPSLNAVVNRATGGGVESTACYHRAELTFLGIGNIHAVRRALEELAATMREETVDIPAADKMAARASRRRRAGPPVGTTNGPTLPRHDVAKRAASDAGGATSATVARADTGDDTGRGREAGAEAPAPTGSGSDAAASPPIRHTLSDLWDFLGREDDAHALEEELGTDSFALPPTATTAATEAETPAVHDGPSPVELPSAAASSTDSRPMADPLGVRPAPAAASGNGAVASPAAHSAADHKSPPTPVKSDWWSLAGRHRPHAQMSPVSPVPHGPPSGTGVSHVPFAGRSPAQRTGEHRPQWCLSGQVYPPLGDTGASRRRRQEAEGPFTRWIGMPRVRARVKEESWFSMLLVILRGAYRVVGMVRSGRPVLVHCSDGWDRTAQLTSLAQLMMDPYYRTIRGFAALIAKEWVAFGHQFARRNGQGGTHPRDRPDDSQRAPVFLQWLDTVEQIRRKHPRQFEFGPLLLVALAEHTYSGRWIEFIADTLVERDGIRDKARSVWTGVMEDPRPFMNGSFLHYAESSWNPERASVENARERIVATASALSTALQGRLSLADTTLEPPLEMGQLVLWDYWLALWL